MTTTKGYQFGVAWIADNDEPTIRDRDDIAGFISTLLLADLFGKESEDVAADILAYRERQDQAKAGTLPAPRKPRAVKPFTAAEAEAYKLANWNTARNLDDLKAKPLDLGQINYAIGASKLPSAAKARAYRYAAYIMQVETAAANA